jgi:shikimate dehydrogenase
VTAPHKERIIPLLDQLSGDALGVGAVNVVRQRNGRLEGFNTDAPAVAKLLRARRVTVAGTDVLVYGAGGASRAVGFALGALRARRVRVWNRTIGRARALCSDLAGTFPKTRFEHVGAAEIPSTEARGFVNASSMGMKGVPSEFVYPDRVPPQAWCLDLVYRPGRTPFLRELGRRGALPIHGIELLAAQALATWELWFGRIQGKARIEVELQHHLARVAK